eukprot:14783593-Alexandrium_andersonii.AAC.1
MSASLVGSEMCIRDSRLRAQGEATRLCHYNKSLPMGLSVQRCANKYPVSYTHLTLPTICSV